MKHRIVASALLALGLAACEQHSQALPFSVDAEATTGRSVSPSEPASLTSAAGASLLFPAGAFASATEVTVTPVAAPGILAASGSPVSRGFRVTPQGALLQQPARVELRLDSDVDPDRAWLASLVVVTDDGVEEIGSTRLDLRAGLAEASIRRLGTLAVVVPDPRAVFVTRTGEPQANRAAVVSPLLPSGTDSLVTRCGGADARCDGLSVTASHNLVDRVQQAAAVYPRLNGGLSITGGRASGEITVRSSVRLLLQSGATAENVEIRGTLRPTSSTVVTEDANSVTLSNVVVKVSGGAEGSGETVSETIRTIVVTKAGAAGFARISRSFELRIDGTTEPASVEITFPVRIHQ